MQKFAKELDLDYDRIKSIVQTYKAYRAEQTLGSGARPNGQPRPMLHQRFFFRNVNDKIPNALPQTEFPQLHRRKKWEAKLELLDSPPSTVGAICA